MLMRLGYRDSEIGSMDDYKRALILAFDERVTHLRYKRLAQMIAVELAQLFRKR